MINFFHNLVCRVPALFITGVMVCLVFLPLGSFAAKQMSSGSGGVNGDPIDGNDYSSGGGGMGGFIYVDQNSVSSNGTGRSGFMVLPASLGGMQIMVVPQFQSGVFTVQFVIVPAVDHHPEATHAE